MRLEGDLVIWVVCWVQLLGLREVNAIMDLNGKHLVGIRNRPKLPIGKIKGSGFAQ